MALTIYMIRTVSRIEPIAWKSMPPTPVILLIRPLDNSVVALPKIFGPTMEKIVLPIAKAKAAMRRIWYDDILLIRRIKLPLKSLAFSVGIPPTGPCLGRLVFLFSLLIF